MTIIIMCYVVILLLFVCWFVCPSFLVTSIIFVILLIHLSGLQIFLMGVAGVIMGVVEISY